MVGTVAPSYPVACRNSGMLRTGDSSVTAVWGRPGRTGMTTSSYAPRTDRDVVIETMHGQEIADPYRWLEDGDSPATRDWVRRQNKYTASLLEAVPGREAIQTRLTELYSVGGVGAPTVR